MDLTWAAFTLREGAFIADLPGLEVSSVEARICDYGSTSATLPIPTAPDDWERALLPWGSVLILSDSSGPVWGGIPTSPVRPVGDQVTVSLVTLERLMAFRYVGDASYVQVSQTQIAADLCATLTADTPLVIEANESATLRDRTYADADDMTLLEAMQNLSGVIGGPEWTIIWRAAGSRVIPVLRIADRLGVATSGVTLEIPGEGTAATLSTQTGPGMIANRVIATSTLDDGTRSVSAPQEASDPERPLLEYRWSPGSKIGADTLADHARGRLSWMTDGAQSLSISLRPRDHLLDGWDVGDTLAYSITSPALTTSGSARVLGWSASLDEPVTVTPALASEEEES